MNNQIVWVDTETTGLDPKSCGIVEIGAVFMDPTRKTPTKKFESLANPMVGIFRGREVRRDVSVSEYAFKVNGIKPEVLQQQESIDLVLRKFDGQVQDKAVIAGWNVSGFDIPFLKEAYDRAGLAWRFHYHVLDIMVVAMWLKVCDMLPGNRGIGLQAMGKYLGIPARGDAHRALPDVYMSIDIARELRDRFLIGKSYKI